MEPIATFSVVYEILKKNVGARNAANHIVVTTDENTGAFVNLRIRSVATHYRSRQTSEEDSPALSGCGAISARMGRRGYYGDFTWRKNVRDQFERNVVE